MHKIKALALFVLIAAFLSTECFAQPKGAVLIDKNNGRVLFEVNKDEPLPMASTTKIMTAMIALEEENKDEFFAVDGNAIKVEGSSMGLLEGDYATLRGLASGMLLASGNDAANAAAVKISGSVEKFVQLMNKRAEEMGLESTSFETPSGLDAEKHFSTAYEMAVIAKKALENPDFAKICGAKNMSAEYGNPPYKRMLSNHNRLLKTLDGATGVKTGFTKKAGRCLVSSAERNGVSLICVTLGCPDDWNYHKTLYDEYFKKLSDEDLSYMVNNVKIPVSGGKEKSVKAVPALISAALFEDEKEKVTAVISREPFVFAPVQKGEVLGKVIYYLNGEFLTETPLLAKETVEKIPEEMSFWDEIKEIF